MDEPEQQEEFSPGVVTYELAALTLVSDRDEDIAADVAAVSRLDSVPTLLEVLCEITGMRFATVARVTENTWTACAVKDELNFGLRPGGHLDVETTLCIESKRLNEPIVIEHASLDPRYCSHHTPKLYKIESYVSVPIVFSNGRYFGNLCAIDPHPAKVADPKIVGMFKRFAALIAVQLETQLAHEFGRKELSASQANAELREQLMAILGHDLRNPLQAVLASSELLQRKAADPQAVGELAARIKTNVKRMSRLIDDVLDFTRGKLGGGIAVKIEEVGDINSGLLEVVREFQVGHPLREIKATIAVSGSVLCDLGRVQQLASNLIGNALTHGAPDSPVTVTAHCDDGDFVLEVWNQGNPISNESLPRVFEPFWRQSTSGNRHGLGLGLHICSQIIRAHGGKLSVNSTKRDGTTFTARLPLRALP